MLEANKLAGETKYLVLDHDEYPTEKRHIDIIEKLSTIRGWILGGRRVLISPFSGEELFQGFMLKKGCFCRVDFTYGVKEGADAIHEAIVKYIHSLKSKERQC
jgi:hypothetical protein